ncbi:MAG: type IX secretion system membrane protein PorP/SprF, partial [Paludibacter sp.]|nr:type IX secretion system membrane protein PorP/SprF [Paludibacter sp.]
MKKLLTLSLFLVFSQAIFSQFEAQLSQYMFNAMAFNPAAAGSGANEMIEVAGQHRISFIDIPGAGQTTAFSIGSPLKIANTRHGIG